TTPATPADAFVSAANIPISITGKRILFTRTQGDDVLDTQTLQYEFESLSVSEGRYLAGGRELVRGMVSYTSVPTLDLAYFAVVIAAGPRPMPSYQLRFTTGSSGTYTTAGGFGNEAGTFLIVD